jgi:transposase
MENISNIYVGVDISKDTLDIYIQPIGKAFKVANSATGIKKLITELATYKITQIACEATGGYEQRLARLLKKSSYDLWIIDPRRIRGFIIASGCRSKTDKIDAQKIAEFATKNSPDYSVISRDKNLDKLRALTNRKNDLTKFLAIEKTRFQHPSHAFCVSNIKKFIKTLTNEIKSIDREIKQLIQHDKNLSKKVEYLESIPGIGQASAAVLLSAVPELGEISNKKISALVGLCPYDNESGKYKGKKFIRGGRTVPRNTLYMCALTTIKYHLPLKKLYDRLIANKKPFKVAIVAVMHKLIVIANSLLKKRELCVTSC